MSKPTVTTNNFERSHGSRPRGSGSWAFQASRTSVAFDRDLVGEMEFFFGTFTEAKAAAVKHFAGAAFVAVLP